MVGERPDLDVELTTRRGTCVVRLRGELDLHTVPHFAKVGTVLDDPSVHTVIVELELLTFLASVGLQELLRLAAAATSSGRRIAMRNPTPIVRRVIDISAVGDALHLEG
jgi:anti-anti-sigma factor